MSLGGGIFVIKILLIPVFCEFNFKDSIFVWGIIRAVDLNNSIICFSIKKDDSFENKGLIESMYVL